MARRLFRFVGALCVSSLFYSPSAHAADVSKVLLQDGTVRELTNSGTRNAVSRLVAADRLPPDAKVQALEAVLLGAAHGGNLEPSLATPGDVLLVLDDSGAPDLYVVPETFRFDTPPTSIIGWWIPGLS